MIHTSVIDGSCIHQHVMWPEIALRYKQYHNTGETQIHE